MKSQRIAVAGGQGKIGKHIVEGLLEAKQRYSLEVIIVLSRSGAPDITYAGNSAPVIAVDYTDQASLQSVLDKYKIDTVISTISGHTPDAFITSQENLLQAALKVPSFHRFAPSEFAIPSEQVADKIKLYQMKLPILQSLRRAKQQQQQQRPGGSFEFSIINCGMFMNYLGYGNTKPDGHKAHGYLARFPIIFDLSRRYADIPGDGEKEIIYTHADDVGRFVAAATQLDVWEEYFDMAGEVVTINEVLRMCEDVCGTKFDVKYNSREDILARMSSAPEKFMENFFMEGYLATIDGDSDAIRPNNLNKLVDVKPMGSMIRARQGKNLESIFIIFDFHLWEWRMDFTYTYHASSSFAGPVPIQS
ncbi:isoflavone reductase [Lentinula edodes]|uniref:Isoflavone reductase n=1 Tax=Lentinula edodes TaxID=5353 RepID=A0A1Q3EIG9_LENED|nr:isoflavone reductase [Lentinula edodes]